MPAGIQEEGSIVPLFGQFPPWDSGRHSTTTETDYLETELQVRDSRQRLDALPMAGPGLWAAQAAGRGRNLVANLPPRSHHVLNWPDDCPRCHQNSQAQNLSWFKSRIVNYCTCTSWLKTCHLSPHFWNNEPALVDSSQPQCARHTSSTKSRFRPCIRPACCAACCQAFPIFLCIRLHNNNSFLIKCTRQ